MRDMIILFIFSLVCTTPIAIIWTELLDKVDVDCKNCTYYGAGFCDLDNDCPQQNKS